MNPTMNNVLDSNRKSEVSTSQDLQQFYAPLRTHPTLRDSVEKALQNYFDHLDGQDVVNVYELVLSEIEAPLL